MHSERRYRVEVERHAARQLAKLPVAIYQALETAIDSLARDPRPPGCKKLQGRGDQYRLRRGDYRIIYEVEDQVLRVLVIEVGHRRDIY